MKKMARSLDGLRFSIAIERRNEWPVSARERNIGAEALKNENEYPVDKRV